MASVFQAGGFINFRLLASKGLQGEGGRFTSAGLAAQRDRNREKAKEIQREVARLIESRIKWRYESTGHLARNTLSEDNMQYDTWGFGVGNPKFLDDSTSKYWRTFEQGSAATWKHPFVGTHLMPRRGMGGASKGTITGFWTNPKGRFVVRHEIEGQHDYDDAALNSALKDFAVRNVHQTLRDILS